MKRTALTVLLVLIGLAVIAAYLTLFTVYQTQQALVLEFGKPKRLITEPGLNYKIPFIQNVQLFDKRLLDLDSAPQEVIAADQKRLVVDAFARWRITNPLLFYQSVNNETGARTQLSAFLEAALRRVLGAASFEAVVRDDRNDLMRKITSELNAKAKSFGITVVDVRIKRADLPEANSLAIYRRMQTERQREAAEIRAEGEEASRRIRADADRQVTVVKAEATGESADAFGKDADFFAFYRSMQAYKGSLRSGDTRMLLSPDSQFFQYFNDAAGGPGGSSSSLPKPTATEDRARSGTSVAPSSP
jgi:membrane protease subunit HflC